jgi:hypothetical protein
VGEQKAERLEKVVRLHPIDIGIYVLFTFKFHFTWRLRICGMGGINVVADTC